MKPLVIDTPIPIQTKKGLTIRKNPVNGVLSVKLHYTADEDKDPSTSTGAQWYERERKRWSEKRWATDFEMSRQTYGGTGVFTASFNHNFHTFETRDFVLDDDEPILLGWDLAGNHSIVFAQYIDQTLWVFDELPNIDWNTRAAVPKVLKHYYKNYPQLPLINVPDPTGYDRGRNDAEGRSNVDVMKEIFDQEQVPFIDKNLGKKLNRIKPRIDAVLTLLDHNYEGKPRICINREKCPMLVMGMQGSYQRELKIRNSGKDASIVKNEFSHVMDALQYLAVFVTTKSGMNYLRKGGLEKKLLNKMANNYNVPRKPRYQF